MEEGDDDLEWPQNWSGSLHCDALEEAVHCSICRDYFNTPLCLLCGHSFCSQCIRSNIQFQERNNGKAFCPQCRHPTDSRQIQANHQLREVVKHFLLARSHLIGSLNSAVQNGRHDSGRVQKRPRLNNKESSKQKLCNTIGTGKRDGGKANEIIQLDSASEQEEGRNSDRQLRKRSGPIDYFPDQDGESEEEIVEDSDASSLEQSAYESSPTAPKRQKLSGGSKNSKAAPQEGKKSQNGLPNNWASCPVCNRSFPMAIFNDHLDRCLKAPKSGASEPVEKKPTKPKKRLEVPPKLLLSLEKDKSLRERLKKFGLSTKGSRQELEQRYTRFRVEVQSALDRDEAGATYSSLAQRITGREVSENHAGAGPQLLRASNKSKQTATAQSTEFEKLISATRQRDATHSGRLESNSTVIPDSSKIEGLEVQGEGDQEACSQPKSIVGHHPDAEQNGGFWRPNRTSRA